MYTADEAARRLRVMWRAGVLLDPAPLHALLGVLLDAYDAQAGHITAARRQAEAWAQIGAGQGGCQGEYNRRHAAELQAALTGAWHWERCDSEHGSYWHLVDEAGTGWRVISDELIRTYGRQKAELLAEPWPLPETAWVLERRCPNCQRLVTPGERDGGFRRCPACQAQVRFPADAEPAEEAAADAS